MADPAVAEAPQAGKSSEAGAEKLIHALAPMFGGTGGIDSWIGPETDQRIVTRLTQLDQEPLSRAQLNQLLVLGKEIGVSAGFFSYYWLECPRHPYDVSKVGGFDAAWVSDGAGRIVSLRHLRWGLYRMYIDCLLYLGNIRSGYRFLHAMDHDELGDFFSARLFNTKALRERGAPLLLVSISRDDRHLIAEMACKTLDDPQQLLDELKASQQSARELGNKRVQVKQLLDGSFKAMNASNQEAFLFAVDDISDQDVDTEQDLQLVFQRLVKRFQAAREAALQNTNLYLSMAGDMDVYVATSMRSRKDFRDMAAFSDRVFGDPSLADLHLRYFDPTMSAAAGHEDKGLIECLMVKCADVLVYCAGSKESLGKDFEAAMALSQGKPVIFYCDAEQKRNFYRDVHPLVRLIDFNTGVAVGAMATTSEQDVVTLLQRLFTNTMQYELEQTKPGYFRLKETVSGCVVRLQTNDELLRSTFWNYYHHKSSHKRAIVAPDV
jgi:hypothetical protein